MSTYNREQIKTKLLNKYKGKIKPRVLSKNIEGLVDEYIEIKEFTKANNDVEELPSKEEVCSWFEEELSDEEMEEYKKQDIQIAKIDMSKIYIKDKLAKEVFKNFYTHKWDPNAELHPTLKMLINLFKIAETTENVKNKNFIISRLINIALMGTVRFYHMENKPYVKETQIVQIVNYFFTVLNLIHNINIGKVKDINYDKDVYIFKTLDALSDDMKEKGASDLTNEP